MTTDQVLSERVSIACFMHGTSSFEHHLVCTFRYAEKRCRITCIIIPIIKCTCFVKSTNTVLIKPALTKGHAHDGINNAYIMFHELNDKHNIGWEIMMLLLKNGHLTMAKWKSSRLSVGLNMTSRITSLIKAISNTYINTCIHV